MSQLKALVDKLLTNVSQAYVPEGYVSEAVLPMLKVVQSSGKIGKYGKNHLRLENDIMGGKGEARRIEIRQYDSDSYFVKPHGLEELIAPEEYANVEQPFDVEKDAVMQLSTLLWLGKEKALADSLTSTSIITQNTTLSGTSQWNDYANSKPDEVANLAKTTVRNACGIAPNTVIMDWQVAEYLRYHPRLVRSLGYADNRAGQLSDADIARALNVKRALIADVVYNTGKEGQSDSLTPVWGKDVVFCVAPESAGKMQKSLGYRVQLAGESPRQVYKQDVVNPPGAKSIIVKDSYDMVLTDVTCAYLVKAAIA